MFDAVPALMTVAVEFIEVVSTVARGSPTAPRLANFSVNACLEISAMNGERSSIRSWKDVTGALGPRLRPQWLWAGRAIYGCSRSLAKSSP